MPEEVSRVSQGGGDRPSYVLSATVVAIVTLLSAPICTVINSYVALVLSLIAKSLLLIMLSLPSTMRLKNSLMRLFSAVSRRISL